MRAPLLLIPALAAAVVAAGCGSDASGEDPKPLPKPKHAPATESGSAHSFEVERVAAGLNRPTFVGAAPGDPDALWVLEQPGRVIRLAGDGSRTVLLDMGDRVLLGAEQGLLGIAFHPDFATTRRVF